MIIIKIILRYSKILTLSHIPMGPSTIIIIIIIFILFIDKINKLIFVCPSTTQKEGCEIATSRASDVK